jgi:hypothetical protein
MDIVGKLNQQVEIRGLHSPFGNLAREALDHITSLEQQAILRDLEIVRLREALEGIYLSDDQVGAEDAREALSTPIDLSALSRHDEEIVGPWKRDAERYRYLRDDSRLMDDGGYLCIYNHRHVVDHGSSGVADIGDMLDGKEADNAIDSAIDAIKGRGK